MFSKGKHSDEVIRKTQIKSVLTKKIYFKDLNHLTTYMYWVWNHNLWKNIYIITVRKRSLDKLMFLQTSVCPGGKGLGTSHASWDRSHGRVPQPLPSSLDARPAHLPSPPHWTPDLGTYLPPPTLTPMNTRPGHLPASPTCY